VVPRCFTTGYRLADPPGQFNLNSEVLRGDLTQFAATTPSAPQDSASGDMFMALLALRRGGAGRECHLPASTDAALRAAIGRLSRSARLSGAHRIKKYGSTFLKTSRLSILRHLIPANFGIQV
jgi:hypothetical protein